MNEQNLIPLNQRTKSEQREIARMGGIKSGKVRLAKKHGKELMQIILSLKEPDEKVRESMAVLGIQDKDMTKEVAMQIRQVEKAIRKADTSAFKEVNRLAGYLGPDTQISIPEGITVHVDNEEQKQIIDNLGK